MKDLIIIMPSFKAGGAQRVLSILMNYIAAQGGSVKLALVKKNAPIEYPLDEKITIIKNNKAYSNKIISIVSEIIFIRKILIKHQGGNCISFITMYNLYTIIASIGLDINVIVSERVAPEMSLAGKGTPIIWLRNYLYRKSNWVVFQTKEAKAYFKKIKGIKNVIIPNPITADLPIKNNYDDKLIFISVARLEEQKNYPLLMTAMDLVVDKYPHAKLYIYGKGSMEKELKAYHDTIHHPGNILFAGFTNDVPRVLMEAYAFVSSSDYEGISNSMLEALAVGTPCICTDCPGGGASEYIENGYNGILVPIKDKEALANAMIYLIENPEKRIAMGKNAVSIRKELDQDLTISKWMKLFQ